MLGLDVAVFEKKKPFLGAWGRLAFLPNEPGVGGVGGLQNEPNLASEKTNSLGKGMIGCGFLSFAERTRDGRMTVLENEPNWVVE